MKIVYLNSSGGAGGLESALFDMMSSVREAEPGWSLNLIVPDGGALAERAKGIGVGVTVLPFPSSLARLGDAGAGGPAGRGVGPAKLLARLFTSSFATAGYVLKLRRVLKELAPDLVHTHGLKTHVLGAWAAPRGVPVVWHLHDYAGRRPVMARLLRASSRRASAAFANSESVAADAREVFGRGGRVRVRTVYNAVDLEHFRPEGEAADLDALAGLQPAGEGTIRVGLVSTLARWKGQRTFLEALSLLPERLRVRGYVTGGALYRTEGSQYRPEELKKMAREFGVEGRVGFTGFVPDAAAAMRALEVVVHASTEPEPFGLVIAEAMACGRAVVAGRAGGAAEIFTEGADALGHAPGDARSLAACIERLVESPELRLALGRAARETAEQRFDRARLAAELAPVYREVCEAGKESKRAERMKEVLSGE